ncbi:purine-nucleoside phosphorylase [Aspergillus lucknowensis]|uniref:Purine nucleoside permease n=1 Tax=Aspergillus lucknowensis TaxID=176173 RepID=A0ABR4LTC6_9EURO
MPRHNPSTEKHICIRSFRIMSLFGSFFGYAQNALGLLHGLAREQIAPKILIVTMFSQEASNWLAEDSALKLDHTIHVPGLSHGYEQVHCTADKSICLMVTGIALVNAALALSALTTSNIFDFSKTYFLLSGIGGVNPKVATIGSVAVAKFAVQVDTQLEFDGREIPSSWTTGYVPMGAPSHDSWPDTIMGNEVFELNDNLRQIAISLSKKATLVDSDDAAKNRALYADSPGGIYDAATTEPDIIEGDVTASNMFFHGRLLGEGFENVVKLYTSGHAQYYMTAMEDTGTLAALFRAALQNRLDFSRIILMRAGSNFDRSYSLDEVASLPFVFDHGGFAPACRNLYLSGIKVVEGILDGWSMQFEKGVKADNYVGDIFGSLGGTPDFGPESCFPKE